MEDTQRGKPDPAGIPDGRHKLGVRPDRCIVLEDAPAGIEAARAGGMRAVAVTFVGHHSAEKLRRPRADLVVPTLADVTADRLLSLLG